MPQACCGLLRSLPKQHVCSDMSPDQSILPGTWAACRSHEVCSTIRDARLHERSGSISSKQKQHLVRLDDDSIFPVREGVLLDIWIQLVAPAQSAGFARPPSDACCNDGPVSWSICLHVQTMANFESCRRRTRGKSGQVHTQLARREDLAVEQIPSQGQGMHESVSLSWSCASVNIRCSCPGASSMPSEGPTVPVVLCQCLCLEHVRTFSC